MPCYRLHPLGFVCGFEPVFEFDGYLFEWHHYHGPMPVTRKDPSVLRKNIPAGFWDMIAVFEKLPDKAKRACLYKEA